MSPRTGQRRFLVTGAHGMLGAAVVDRLQELHETVVSVDFGEADLTDPAQADALVRHVEPTIVIHCAAYTSVDGAETEPRACRAANVFASEQIARACADIRARMLLVSTDYVFDGLAREPYRPDSPANPLSVYGQSKMEAEQAVARALDDHQIVRTAWLFGPGRRNFVLAILDRLCTGRPIDVVEDQVGSPSYTCDLARVLVELSQAPAVGAFHATNGGHCSWFEFARAIAECTGNDPELIRTATTRKAARAAARPAWSVLDCAATWALGIEPLRPWHDALLDYLERAGLRTAGAT